MARLTGGSGGRCGSRRRGGWRRRRARGVKPSAEIGGAPQCGLEVLLCGAVRREVAVLQCRLTAIVGSLGIGQGGVKLGCEVGVGLLRAWGRLTARWRFLS